MALHQTDPKAQGYPLTSPYFHACMLCLRCSWGAHHRGTDKQPIPTGSRRQPSLVHPCEAPQGQQPSSPEPREGLWAHPRWPAQGTQTGTLTHLEGWQEGAPHSFSFSLVPVYLPPTRILSRLTWGGHWASRADMPLTRVTTGTERPWGKVPGQWGNEGLGS